MERNESNFDVIKVGARGRIVRPDGTGTPSYVKKEPYFRISNRWRPINGSIRSVSTLARANELIVRLGSIRAQPAPRPSDEFGSRELETKDGITNEFEADLFLSIDSAIRRRTCVNGAPHRTAASTTQLSETVKRTERFPKIPGPTAQSQADAIRPITIYSNFSRIPLHRTVLDCRRPGWIRLNRSFTIFIEFY